MKSRGTGDRFAFAWPALACACAPVVEFALRGRFGGESAGSLTVGFQVAGTAGALAAALAAGWRIRALAASGWLAGFVAVLLASACFGKGGWAALPSLSLWTACLLVFVLCSMTAPAGVSLSRVLAVGLIVQAVASSLFAVWQRHFGFALIAESSAYFAGMDGELAKMMRDRIAEGRSFGFFLYPNSLAGYLILALPAALEGAGRAAAAGRKAAAALFGAACLLTTAGLVYSGSIGAAAALAAAFAVTAAIRRKDTLRGFALAAGGALAVLLLILALRPPLSAAGGFSAKLAHIKEALLAPVSPAGVLLGRGPGAYGREVGIQMAEGLRSRYAHNWIVETWAETGAAGVAALAGALFLVGVAVVRAARPGSPAFSLGLSVGWLAWLLHSFGDIDYALPALAFPWWAVSGVLAGTAGGKTASPVPVVPPRFLPAVLRFGALFLAGLCLVLVSSKGAWCSLFLGIGFSAALVLFFAASLPGPGMPGRFHGVDAACLVLLGAAGGWILVSASPGPAYETALKLCGLLAVAWSARAAARADKRVEGWMRVYFILLCAGLSLWALGSVAGGAPSGRASFASPNALAGFLLGGLGLCLGTAWREERGRRLGSLAAAVLICGGLAATGSAAAGAAAALAACGVLLLSALRAGSRGLWRWAAALSLPILVVIAGVPAVDSSSMMQRLSMWREAAELIRERPFGLGPGRYASAVDAVRERSITSAGVGRFSLHAEFAHNEPLQFAAEWGIPALGLAALAIIGAVRAGWPGFLPWGAACLAILSHGMADFPLRVPAVQVFLALAFGLMTAGGPKWRPVSAVDRGPRKWAVLTAILMVLTAAFAARPGLYRLMMERPAENAAQDISVSRAARPVHPLAHDSWLREGAAAWAGFAGMPGKPAPYAAAAESMLRKAAVLSGHEWSSEMFLGRFLFDRALILGARKDREEAGRIFEGAARFAPSLPQSEAWLARVWIAERKWDRALAALDRAETVEPLYLEACVLRAYVEEQKGDQSKARHLYRRALIIHGQAVERGGMNDYERSLVWINESEVNGRLLNLGRAR